MAQTLYICRGSDVETASDITFSQSGMVLNGTIQTADVDSITTSVPSLRFVGGDISMLPKYEAQQASYKDAGGKAITDVLAFLKEQGWNTMRVRLFVDPTKTDDKKSVVQDLDYVQTLGQRIKQAQYLLRFTNLNVSEVSNSLGFDTLASFSNLFKHLVGISPSRYQQGE